MTPEWIGIAFWLLGWTVAVYLCGRNDGKRAAVSTDHEPARAIFHTHGQTITVSSPTALTVTRSEGQGIE